ncbi:hypothetical protein SDJN03_07002, partial [Cucurbita argyrosperma subsp. sororia]
MWGMDQTAELEDTPDLHFPFSQIFGNWRLYLFTLEVGYGSDRGMTKIGRFSISSFSIALDFWQPAPVPLFRLEVGCGSDDQNRKILLIFVLHFSKFFAIGTCTSSDLRWGVDQTTEIGRFSKSSFSIPLDFLQLRLEVGHGSNSRNRKILKIFVLHYLRFLAISAYTSSNWTWDMDQTTKI